MERQIENFEGEKSIETIATENFEIWKNALRAKNLEEVIKLYSEDATFLPTLSEEFKKGQIGAKEYFTHFLEKNPSGEIIEEEAQTLGDDCYMHSGMYNFEVDSDDGRQVVEARFTFIFKKDDQGEWKIVHHHSSLKPKSE